MPVSTGQLQRNVAPTSLDRSEAATATNTAAAGESASKPKEAKETKEPSLQQSESRYKPAMLNPFSQWKPASTGMTKFQTSSLIANNTNSAGPAEAGLGAGSNVKTAAPTTQARAPAQKAGVDPKVVEARVKEFKKMAETDPSKAGAYLHSLPPAELAGVIKELRYKPVLRDTLAELPRGAVEQIDKKVRDAGDPGALRAWNATLPKIHKDIALS